MEGNKTSKLKAIGTAIKLFFQSSEFFKNIWKFLTFILMGMLIGMRLKKAPAVVNLAKGDYVGEQSTSIGKLKQKGKGNAQEVTTQQAVSKKERRKERRQKRKEKREAKE